MEIVIKNFRSIKEKTLNLENGIHLLKGKSGIGKSTVLDSVEWCLFGGKGCFPIGVKTPKKSFTEVTLKTKNITITRSKPPDMVKVVTSEKELTFQEAQDFIETVFGSKNYWLSSSYLKQNTRNILFTSSQIEKMELIKEIIFQGDSKENPDWYLEKIQNHVKEIDLEMSSYNGKLELLDVEIKNYPTWKKEITISDIKKITDKKDKVVTCLQNLESEKKIGFLVKEKEELLDLKDLHENFQQMKNLADSLGIDYQKSSIENAKKSCREKLNRQTNFTNFQKVLEKVKNLETQLETFSKDEKVVDCKITETLKLLELPSDSNILQIKAKYKLGKNNIYKCPSCNENLSFTSKGLELENHGFHLKDSDSEKIFANIKFLENRYSMITKLEDSLEKYKEMLKTFDVDSNEDFKGFDCYHEKVVRLEFYDFDLDRYLYLKEKVENAFITKELEDNFIEKLVYLDPPKNFNNYYDRFLYLTNNYQLIEKELKSLKLSESSQIEEKIIKCKETLEKIEKLENVKKRLELENRKNEIQEKWNKLCTEKEQTLKIKKIIETTKSQVFQNLIYSFNTIVSEILTSLFDDIVIELDMFKEIKGKGVKSSFNIKIVYRGLEYENISSLSGGEKDRVSIALTIALNIISSNNILILDEPMASLDDEMKEKCLEVIKKYSSDKIVINVCHSITEGYYDNILTI